MPSTLVRTGAAAAAVAVALAADGVPSCAKTGTGFNDPKRADAPNGGFPPDAMACQSLCHTTVFCERFTFYTDTKGCWLQGNNYTTVESEYAVSGPVKCEAAVVTDATTAKEGAETSEPLISGEDAASTKTLVGAEGSAAGGVPWWGIVAGGVGAAVVGAGAMAAMAPSDKRKKASKRSIEVGKQEGPKTAAELYAQMAGVELGPEPVPAPAPAPAPAPSVQFLQMAPMPQMAPYVYPGQASYVQVPAEPVQYYQVVQQ